MRKLLISILLILLIILAYFTIFEGISIGDFEILSTSGIVKLNDNLTTKIEEANKKIKSDLQSKETELKQNIDILLDNKESYYNLANVSTESEISRANTEETYTYEYLSIKIGRYARTEGVNLTMNVKTGDAGDEVTKNLDFTLVGQYFAIMDFISALEDDSELDFRIEDFHMTPSSEDNLQATFNVTGVRIKIENTTVSVNDNAQADIQNQENPNNVAQ
mgnify:CR=1 FL=1